MNSESKPKADWYPDPGDPSQLRFWDGSAWTDNTSPAGRGPSSPTGHGSQQPSSDRVFGITFRYGMIVGAVTGAVSGTVAFPVIGTILGVLLGAVAAVPAALAAGYAISRAVGTPDYQRRVDLTLLVLGVLTAALAIGWISLRALVGPWPAIAMLATVVAGLLLVRPRLHGLASPPSAA